MIISKTPFRISFFGGGTDYPIWCQENNGAVLGCTIDKYCYISCRFLPPFFEHKSRLVYSKIEMINYIDEIVHPAVRETLKHMNIKEGLEIHHDGDLPARSGLGSSSAFTVGLLNSLYALRGCMVSKQRLAKEAIYIEQERIKENVGSQDQVMAAYGGMNIIEFNSEGFEVNPIIIKKERIEELQNHLMLFYTGISRTASYIALEQINNTPKKKRELSAMYDMVWEAQKILDSESDIEDFGRLLNESWRLKKSLSDKISSHYIDYLYQLAIEEGAVGGKLLGAGGGGFLLLFAKPENQEKIKERLKGVLQVNFCFENKGSSIIYYSSND